MSHTKSDLLEAKTSLIAYVVSKIKSGDWHAVQDGASDIREIDAQLVILNELPQSQTPQGLPAPASYPPPSGASQLAQQYQQYQGAQTPTTSTNVDYDKWAKRIG